MKSFRFSVQIQLYDVDRFILHAIDNCAKHVEKIYIAYSLEPWTYGNKARDKHKNVTQPDILKCSSFFEKIILIEGIWNTEEEQRNACLDAAKKDGMDYMVIQDADEFYSCSDYQTNLDFITANPGYEAYRVPLYCYWKSTDWVLEGKSGDLVTGFPLFAVPCRNDLFFMNKRATNGTKEYTLPGICHHLSYVLDDAELQRKLATWGHASDFDTSHWFSQKWSRWHPRMKNLHPLEPSAWKRARRVTHPLPEGVQKISMPQVLYKKPTLRERFSELVYEVWGAKDKAREAIIVACKRCGVYEIARRCYHMAKLVSFRLRMMIDCYAAKVARTISLLTWKKRVKKFEAANGKLRLHLGCGSDRHVDMVNCEYRNTPAADIVMDCADLSRFAKRSVSFLYSHAFFEHLYVKQHLPFLLQCARILEKNGHLVFVGLPDFSVVAGAYIKQTPLRLGLPFDLHMVYRYTHGAPEYTAPGWWLEQLHKCLFDRVTLCALLREAGFGGAALFNYRYPNEDVALNLGCIAWLDAMPEHTDLENLLAPARIVIRDFSDIYASIEYVTFDEGKADE